MSEYAAQPMSPERVQFLRRVALVLFLSALLMIGAAVVTLLVSGMVMVSLLIALVGAVDFIAASAVRRAADVGENRAALGTASYDRAANPQPHPRPFDPDNPETW